MTFDDSFQRGFERARRRDRKWERNRNRQRSPVASLVVGSLIAVWGLGLLLDDLGLGDVRHYMHRVWPAVFVIVGIMLLIRRDADRNRYGFWGTVCLLGGAWLYASQQNWIHASFWGSVGSALLVMLGASFVYRAFDHRRVDTSTDFDSGSLPPTVD